MTRSRGRPALPLTHPENTRMVLALANGKRGKEVAHFEDINYFTFKSRMKSLCDRLKLKTTTQLVAYYLRQGWIK